MVTLIKEYYNTNELTRTLIKIAGGLTAYLIVVVINRFFGNLYGWEFVSLYVAPVSEEILKYFTGWVGALTFGIYESIEYYSAGFVDINGFVTRLYTAVVMHVLAVLLSRKYNILAGILAHALYNNILHYTEGTIFQYDITVVVLNIIYLIILILPKRSPK